MFPSDQLLYLFLFVTSGVTATWLWRSLIQDEKRSQLWVRVDIVGIPNGGNFRWTRALMRSLTSTRHNIHIGYERISKGLKRPFAVPTMWTGDAMLVLPATMLGVLRKPESEVTGFEALTGTLGLPYMISDRRVYTNTIHFDVVRRYMKESKDLDAIAPVTADEIGTAFRDCWGTSEEWTHLNAWEDSGRIITRAATRVLVGLPMCRDKTFEKHSRQFSQAVMMGAAIINCFPPFMRGLVGPLVAFQAKRYQARCLKVLLPHVEERISLWKTSQGSDHVSVDFLQWLIPQCAKQGPEEMDPTRIATRILTSSIMFIVGMNYVFANCVLDIYGDPLKDDVLDGLAAEGRRVRAEHTGLSTRRAAQDLVRHGSAIRESMRVSDFNVAGLPRDVVSGELDLGNGTKVPRGIRIVFPTQAIHQDPEFYPDPLRFDAFRFSRHLEGPDSKANQEPQREDLADITQSFLAWGHGRGNCPGRWFAAQTMKQALAHLILHYEVEVTKRPDQRKSLLSVMLPPTDAEIKVRWKS